MKSQELYQAITEAYEDILRSPSDYQEFLVAQTAMDKVLTKKEGKESYSIISKRHMNNVCWTGRLPKIFYSTTEGSYSDLHTE